MGGTFEPELINTGVLRDTIFQLIINEVGRSSPKAYLLVLLTALLVAGGLLIFRSCLSQKLRRCLTAAVPQDGPEPGLLAEGVDASAGWLSLFIIYWAWSFLHLSAPVQTLIHGVFALAFTLAGVRFFSVGANLLLHRLVSSQAARRGAQAIMPVLRILIWCLGLIYLLDALGFEVGNLIAGMGIVGLAIGLASKAILEDFFSYLVILMDKPFAIGDLVEVGEVVGRVEHIGLKTTRIRTVGGDVKIVPNAELTSQHVGNYDPEAIEEHSFTFGVSYLTPLELLRRVPGMIRDSARDIEGISDVRAHFVEFGDQSLVFLVAFNLVEKNSALLLNAKEKLHFDMFDRFAREGVALAGMTAAREFRGHR